MTTILKISDKTKTDICSCGNEYRIAYDFKTGIRKNKECPNCSYKKAFKKNSYKQESAYISKKKGSKRTVQNTNKSKFNFYSTRAWKYLSHYTLLYFADDNLNVRCSTSPELIYQITDKRIHCGHYIKVKDGTKSNYAVSLEFCNVAPQSYRDNCKRGGDQLKMRSWLVKQHGEDAISQIEFKQYNNCKPDVMFLEYWGNYWERKYKALLIEKNIKDPWKKPT